MEVTQKLFDQLKKFKNICDITKQGQLSDEYKYIAKFLFTCQFVTFLRNHVRLPHLQSSLVWSSCEHVHIASVITHDSDITGYIRIRYNGFLLNSAAKSE